MVFWWHNKAEEEVVAANCLSTVFVDKFLVVVVDESASQGNWSINHFSSFLLSNKCLQGSLPCHCSAATVSQGFCRLRQLRCGNIFALLRCIFCLARSVKKASETFDRLLRLVFRLHIYAHLPQKVWCVLDLVIRIIHEDKALESQPAKPNPGPSAGAFQRQPWVKGC